MIIYQDDIGRVLKVDTGKDISDATEVAVVAKKGRVIKKITGSLEGTGIISAIIPSGFFSEIGVWMFQALYKTASTEFYGTPFSLRVDDNIKDPS